ncbi:MAG: hypothetical protein JAY66_15855 [Candidatus Thiodiazotropha taylori]|nr:hypothetical protein [Candidatus Thiodiazotropha taylori]
MHLIKSNPNNILVGFNNINFDYPIIHHLMTLPEDYGEVTPSEIYKLANSLIQKKYKVDIPPWEHLIPQLDLFRLHHFNNPARLCSLKKLEFAMRLKRVSDLPFPPGTLLKKEDVKVLLTYNADDVRATTTFYHASKEKLKFRKQFAKEMRQKTERYIPNLRNANDVALGRRYMRIQIEQVDPSLCFEDGAPRQSHRDEIQLRNCIKPVTLQSHSLIKIRDYLASQTVTHVKQAFKNLVTSLDGCTVKFGTGGLHVARKNTKVTRSDNLAIWDFDVISYYSHVIANLGLYPEHLTPVFTSIYRQMLKKRLEIKENTPEKKILKMALNGVFGDSNSPYSFFYDPQFFLSVTLNGQLILCSLIETLLEIDGVRLIQGNTDGVTVTCPLEQQDTLLKRSEEWSKNLKFPLTHTKCDQIHLRDVNNYLIVKSNGEIKAKGIYNAKLEWHQNHSMLVIPKVVQLHLTTGIPVDLAVMTHTDPFDFMGMASKSTATRYFALGKLNSNELTPQGTFIRYYISRDNDQRLFKIMKPLPGKLEQRINAVHKGHNVTICNVFEKFTVPVDYDYYIAQAISLINQCNELNGNKS